ncbi:MAG: hypothetical protein ABIR58_09495 [Gemmatimonadaceae bacterium]
MNKSLLLAVPLFALAACSENIPTAPNAMVPTLSVATAPGQNKIECFQGGGGICTLDSNGAKGSATLDLTATPGSYAGVETPASTLNGELLTDVTQLSYHYTGTTTPTPGTLSFNIPIDSDGNGSFDFYLFVDAFYCPGTDGVVNIISDANCIVYAGGVTPYANWAAFVAAYPGGRVSATGSPFILASRTTANPPAVWTVSNVKFGKAGK